MSKPLIVVCLAALSGWGCTHQSVRPSMPVAIAAAEATPPLSPAPLPEPDDAAAEAELERRDSERTLAQARANGCVALPR